MRNANKERSEQSMRVLAIDTSGLVASVALVEDDVLRAEFTTNDKKTHSQTLLPMLDQLRQMTSLELDTVDAIAIAAGPGSFTGLRIGSATAKGLGLALDKPLVEVPTLEGLAYNLYGTDKLVCPMMDARRNQVYTGLYEYLPQEGCLEVPPPNTDWCNIAGRSAVCGSRESLGRTLQKPINPVSQARLTICRSREGVDVAHSNTDTLPGPIPGMREGISYGLHVLRDQCAVDVSEIVEECNRLGREVVFLGDGVPVYLKQIQERIRVPYSLAPAHLNRQRAASVAALGALYASRGRVVGAAEHQPIYLRKSQAEREREEADDHTGT